MEEEMEELYEAALLDPSLRPEAIKALKDAAGGLGASDISERGGPEPHELPLRDGGRPPIPRIQAP